MLFAPWVPGKGIQGLEMVNDSLKLQRPNGSQIGDSFGLC